MGKRLWNDFPCGVGVSNLADRCCLFSGMAMRAVLNALSRS